MAAKDTFELQTQRLEKALHELMPSAQPFFNKRLGAIQMRVEDADGKVLFASGDDYQISVLADKSDVELKQLLNNWYSAAQQGRSAKA